MSERHIGSLGTAARLIVGVGLLVVAWLVGVNATAIVLGLVGLPAAFVVGPALRGANAPPLHLEAPIWHCINITIGFVLFTAAPVAAMLFYGTSMVIAAWRGIGACEIFAISNWLRRRDDRLGCPLFLPVDALEASVARRVRADG